MTLAALHASLRLWKRRLVYRRRKRHHYLSRGNRALAAKWQTRVDRAEALVARRNRQIVSRNRANRRKAKETSGVTRFDGVPVAAWMVPYLRWARENGWRGRLVSGWRDPNYSRSLCIRICGAPSCPGRCAGLASNHVGSQKPRGAVDVSDYERFAELMRRCPLEPRLFNALGAQDPVHFSASGR